VQQAVDVRSSGELLAQFTGQRGLQVLPGIDSAQYGSCPVRTRRMVSRSPAGVISTARTRSVMDFLYHERPSDTVDRPDAGPLLPGSARLAAGPS
jgi:hypothetical protein